MTVRLSVIVPAFNAASDLPRLMAALAAQTYPAEDVILVDDASTDATARLAADAGIRVVSMPVNRGPAACRNAGVAAASGDVLVFTDADCRPEPDWLERLRAGLDAGRADAVMGRVFIEPSGVTGRAIAALGFPAGGSIGFEKIWPVDDEGFTVSLSTCNCAVSRKALVAAGGFDTGFPYAGGEDSLLAYRLIGAGRRIRFCPEAVVWHAAREDLGEFIRWQFKRGISARIFSEKVARLRGYVSLRLWSTRNILQACVGQRLFPLVLMLFIASAGLQVAGFISAGFQQRISNTGCSIR